MKTDEDKIQYIYNSLCDEESRYIFENRRRYAESGDWKYMENIVSSIPEYATNIYCNGKEKCCATSLRNTVRRQYCSATDTERKRFMMYYVPSR